MKKSLSLVLSIMLVMTTLFALPFNATAEEKDINDPSITFGKPQYTFNIYSGMLEYVYVEVRDGGKLLEVGTDYNMGDNTQIKIPASGVLKGIYTVYGEGKYTGSKDFPLSVKAPTKSKAGPNANWVYDSKKKFLRISGKGEYIRSRVGDADYIYIDGVSVITTRAVAGDVSDLEHGTTLKVKNITVTGKVKTIEERAFTDVSGLKNIDLQSGVKTIKAGGLVSSSKVFKSIYIPKSVTKIGKESVGYKYVEYEIPEDRGNYDWQFEKDKNFVIIGESGSAAQKYAKKNKFKFIALKPSAVSKVKGAKKSFTVNYKKAKGATGYQVQYSKNKYFASGNKTVKVKGAKNVKKTVKKLKAGKYYVRVRTYKTVKKKTYYSNWSKAKAVKVK